MKHPVTLHVNGVDYPVEVEPHIRACSTRCATSSG